MKQYSWEGMFMPLRTLLLALMLVVSVSPAHAETQRLSGKILLAEVSNNRLLISSASDETPAQQIRYTHTTHFTNIVSIDQLQTGEEVQVEATQVEPNIWKASSIRLSSEPAARASALPPVAESEPSAVPEAEFAPEKEHRSESQPVFRPEPVFQPEPQPEVQAEPQPQSELPPQREPNFEFESAPAPAPQPASTYNPVPERRRSEPHKNFSPKKSAAAAVSKPAYQEKMEPPTAPPGPGEPDRTFLDKLAHRIERLHDDVIQLSRGAFRGGGKTERKVDRYLDARDASSRIRSRSDL